MSTTSTPTCRREDGTWEAAVELPPGRHRYCYFVVDDGVNDVANESYIGRLGVINLGSELCVPEDEGSRPSWERMELLN